MEKLADLFTAKDKNGNDYLVSRLGNGLVYYIFKNSYPRTNNADYFLYIKKVTDSKKFKRKRSKWKR